MKRKNIVNVSKIVAEESSDAEEELESGDDQQTDVSDDSQEMEEHEEHSEENEGQNSVSDNDDKESREDDEEMEDEEQSGVSDNNDKESLDLAASDTDSDEDDEDEVKDDIKHEPSKAERIREELVQKYRERQGKQLYIRFPHKVAETEEALEKEVKELTPLVVKVHKPRQKHARFCLVDFASNEDRDTAFKQLKKTFSKGDFAKYVVNIPKTESQDLVNELAERKIKSIENKKAKNRLKLASKKALKENNFTSTVIVLNLPKTATAAEIRELFPNAVDIQIKAGRGKMNKDKSIAAINLPTTMDARNAIKNKLSLGGNQLTIKFDNQKMGRNKKRKSEDTATEASKPLNKKLKMEPSTEILKNDSSPQLKVDFKAKLNHKKPFVKGNNPLIKGGKPFNNGTKPFNKGNKAFNKGNRPFNKGNKPFNKVNKPFIKGNKPFNKVNKPFNKGNKPFQKGSNPFKKDQKIQKTNVDT